MNRLVLCWGVCWHATVIPHKHLTGNDGPCPPQPVPPADPKEAP